MVQVCNQLPLSHQAVAGPQNTPFWQRNMSVQILDQPEGFKLASNLPNNLISLIVAIEHKFMHPEEVFTSLARISTGAHKNHIVCNATRRCRNDGPDFTPAFGLGQAFFVANKDQPPKPCPICNQKIMSVRPVFSELVNKFHTMRLEPKIEGFWAGQHFKRHSELSSAFTHAHLRLPIICFSTVSH